MFLSAQCGQRLSKHLGREAVTMTFWLNHISVE